MFYFGITAWIFSLCIFFLSAFSIIDRFIFLFVTTIFVGSVAIYFTKTCSLKILREYKFFTSIFIMLCLVNLIGALGPEVSFDALWYHLTIPKIYIEEGHLGIIPGGLFYYSGFPQTGEMLYLVSIYLGNEIVAKLIHLLFGLATAAVVYRIAKRYVDKKYSFMAAMIFYSNLVVAWLSNTAYIDLIRAFYESLALFALLIYLEDRKRIFLFLAGLLLGIGISVKLISLGSLLIFAVLVFISRQALIGKLKDTVLILTMSVLVVSPWWFLNIYSGYMPFYPIFHGIIPSDISFQRLMSFDILLKPVKLFLYDPDPLTPLYAILIPVFVLKFRTFFHKYKVMVIYCILAVLVWIVTPFAGGRFFTAYLPGFSVLAVLVIRSLTDPKIRKFCVLLIVTFAMAAAFYRLVANYKYLNVLTGKEAKNEFLMRELNFNFGDFYDDNHEIKNLVGSDVVLITGFHNLYYVDFKFVHESYYNKEEVGYVITKGAMDYNYDLELNLIYQNAQTGVYLYEVNN